MSFKTLAEQVLGLCNDVFGTTVSYTPNGSTAVSIKAVFDNAWVEAEGVSSMRPVLRIQLSDLASDPGKGDQVTIEGTTYRVMESQKDAHGGATLILQKA